MTTLNDLHGKVPPPPVHVVALGFNGPWEVQTMNVRLATCRDRSVADFIAALWNLMPATEEPKPITTIPDPELYATAEEMRNSIMERETVLWNSRLGDRPKPKFRRRKAGKSVQVMP